MHIGFATLDMLRERFADRGIDNHVDPSDDVRDHDDPVNHPAPRTTAHAPARGRYRQRTHHRDAA